MISGKNTIFIIMLFVISNVIYWQHSATNAPENISVKITEATTTKQEINPNKAFGHSEFGFVSGSGISLSSPSYILRLYPGRSSESGIFLFFLSQNVLSSFSFRKDTLSDIFLKKHSLRQNSVCFPPCKYFVFALRKIII